MRAIIDDDVKSLGGGPHRSLGQKPRIFLVALEPVWHGRCFCSPASVIRPNQALSRRVVDHKLGTAFITETATANHSHTRPRGNSVCSEMHGHCFIRDRSALFECATAEAICGYPWMLTTHTVTASASITEGRSDSTGPKCLRPCDSCLGSFVIFKDVDQDMKRLLLIEGYGWKQSEKSSTRAVNTDIDKGCGRFDLRFCFSLNEVITNEAISHYPLLQ